MIDLTGWVPQIGDKVRVTEHCEFCPDWRDTPLWVAGVRVHDDGNGLDVTTAEQWPIPWRGSRDYRGLTDGWRVCGDTPDHLAAA